MMEQMTKNDLRTGMHVVTRDGSELVVLKDTLFGEGDIMIAPHEDSNSGAWLSLNDYNDNLTYGDKTTRSLDIVRVYQPKYHFTTLEYKLDTSGEDLSDMLFAEETMTKAEAEEKFGIRIVD